MVCTMTRSMSIRSFSLSLFSSDAKENNRETNSNTDSINEQDQTNDVNNQSNLGSQKFRRRDYHPPPPPPQHLNPPR